MQAIETVVEVGAASPNAPRFALRGFGMVSHPAGFGGPELRRAMMLMQSHVRSN